jgi:hypothetical protein
MASSVAMQTGFTITLNDGTVYDTPEGDFLFKDGLSIVHEGQRIYLPKTSIRSILIHR